MYKKSYLYKVDLQKSLYWKGNLLPCFILSYKCNLTNGSYMLITLRKLFPKIYLFLSSNRNSEKYIFIIFFNSEMLFFCNIYVWDVFFIMQKCYERKVFSRYSVCFKIIKIQSYFFYKCISKIYTGTFMGSWHKRTIFI